MLVTTLHTGAVVPVVHQHERHMIQHTARTNCLTEPQACVGDRLA